MRRHAIGRGIRRQFQEQPGHAASHRADTPEVIDWGNAPDFELVSFANWGHSGWPERRANWSTGQIGRIGWDFDKYSGSAARKFTHRYNIDKHFTSSHSEQIHKAAR